MTCHYKFSAVSGIFDDYAEIAKQSSDNKARTQPSLGLLNRTYVSDSADTARLPQWVRFTRYLQYLNETSPHNESYKLLYIIRHGTGVHNVVMSEVGDDWRKKGPKWAFLEGGNIPKIGQVNWVDAKLVDAGIKDAKTLSRFLVNASHSDSMPLPCTIYTSPLARCLETTKLAYQDVMTQHGKPFRPVVKELLRERLTGHTCDRRSSKSWIAENYPDYCIEDGFVEDDRLWWEHRDPAEGPDEHIERKQRLLEDIFATDGSPIVSLTTHSYAVTGIHRAVGCADYRVAEGTMVPLLVKAVRVENSPGRETEAQKKT